MTRFDFDAFKAEVTEEVHTVKFKGKDIKIPSQMPYFAILQIADMSKKSNLADDITLEETKRLLLTIFGEETLQDLEKTGASALEIQQLLVFITEIYNTGNAPIRETPNPKATEKPARGKPKAVLTQSS